MSSHIQLVEDGRVIGLDGGQWALEPVNDWVGFPCEVHRHMERGEVARRYNPHPLIFLRYGARGRSRIVSGRNVYELDVAPLQVDVFPSGFHMDHGWWDCSPGHLVTVSLDGSALGPLFDREPLSLQTVLSGTDRPLLQLVDCMRLEIASGCPSGKLFADGLSLALHAQLRGRFERSDARVDDGLPGRLRDRIADYIDAHLADDLRIATLAAVVDHSPSFFNRLFRRTFGRTPHQYVLDRRLRAAHAMLGGRGKIVGIALACGFASQAHFTAAYRRWSGRTPGERRRADAKASAPSGDGDQEQV